ncbi:hypothetical protein LSAT2_028312 [Lamellibrachia satsuma]|nr:hypothetical protein LSAT2_028312 [Lamellibrachia satsuma]
MYIPIDLTCSASCGQNGIKVSTRVQIQLGSCEMSECYMKETKTDKCTSPCLNGRAIGGRCKCNDGFTGECCNVGDTVSVVEPCEKRGGVCLEYWQSCARGNYDYGLCGRDGNRVCCIAAKVEKPTAPPVNMECKDKGGRCTAYWSDCAGGNFAYGICGANSIYECCIPDKRVTQVIPTWENECKRQDGRCLFAWKTDCFGDVLYGLCGGGGHECCVSNIKAASHRIDYNQAESASYEEEGKKYDKERSKAAENEEDHTQMYADNIREWTGLEPQKLCNAAQNSHR